VADISATPFISYGLVQAQQAQAQASASLQNQEAQKAALDNQFTQASMPYMMRALHSYSDGGAPMQNPVSIGNNPDTSGVAESGDPNSDTNLRLRSTVVPFLPDEQRRLGQAAILSSKMPGLLQMEQFRREQRIALQTQQNQVRNGNLFDGMRAVTNADPGQAMSMLAATNMAPDTVAALVKQYGSDKDGADNAARAYAHHVAGAAHQYSGREVVQEKDGNYYDKQSGFQVPGTGHVGMSDQEWSTLAAKGMELKEVPTGDGDSTMQVPLWKAEHAPSLDAWVMQTAAAHGNTAAHPSNTGVPHIVAQQEATKAAADARTNATPQQKQADKTPQYKNPDGSVDKTMTDAMADKAYDINMPRYPYGTKPPSEVVQAKQAAAKSSASLSKDAGDTITSARAALVMYKAAQDTLAKGHYDGGAWSAELAKVAKWLPPGFQSALATGDYQTLSKYLGNAALQQGKGTFQKMTQQEAKWLKEELNPSAAMQPDALRNLIDMNIKQSNYVLDSARRATAYVGSDKAHPIKDPDKFNDWNQKYYPMEKIVTEGPPAAPAGPSEITSQKDYDALPKGAAYLSGGKLHHKGGK
jgi:hypothetical protein